jgi:PKD repeat protein
MADWEERGAAVSATRPRKASRPAPAENEEAAAKPRGWLKTFLALGGMVFGTLGGLASGVCINFFSPLVDRAVKPPKPVANFRAEQDALTVRFTNLAPGFSGWWDFGDGSELVPVTAGQDGVPHAYPRAGDYTAKMTLANTFGDEDERVVTLHVGTGDDGAPHVDDLQAVPLSPGSFAPATFRIVSTTSHAPLCVWDLGDERPLESVADAAGPQERQVYFQKPGAYTIKLMALNGARQHQKTLAVTVREAPEGSVGVVLTATDSGTHVKTNTRAVMLTGAVDPATPPGKPAPIKCEFAAQPNWTIADMQWKQGGKDASLGNKDKLDISPAELGLKNVQGLHVDASDRRKVVVSGTMVRPAGNASGWESSFALPVTLVEKQQAPDTRTTTMTGAVTVPAGGPASGAVAVPPPPPPAEWPQATRTLRLEVRDGRGAPAGSLPVPGNAVITIQNRRYTAAARLDKDQVRVDFTDAGGRNGAE